MTMTKPRICTAEEAKAYGYAEFNGVPHLAVDVPDGDGFTITAKTSEGKRITFSFMPYRDGGPPQCVDIMYHDNGTIRLDRAAEKMPTFDVLLFGQTKPGPAYIDQYDSREQDFKPGIVCVLMDNERKAV